MKEVGNNLNFRGIIFAPINEQGVIVIFSKIAEDLGFYIETIQQQFPDCTAFRRVSEEKLKRVIIEFEYDSNNFQDHGHPIDECDIIVCWKHSWRDYPKDKIEVLCLEEIVLEFIQMDYETSKEEIGEAEIQKLSLSKKDREVRDLFHRLGTPREILSLYYYLEPKIKAINDSIWINVIKYSITFNIIRKFLHIDPQKNALKIWYYTPIEWPSVKVKSEEDIDKIMPIIEESYELIAARGASEKIVYTENLHLDDKPELIKKIYQTLRKEIINLDNKIIVNPVKYYIGFKLAGNLFTSFEIKNTKIKIYLYKPKEKFNDPKALIENVPESYNWGNISWFEINNSEDISYTVQLISQSYEIFKKSLQ